MIAFLSYALTVCVLALIVVGLVRLIIEGIRG